MSITPPSGPDAPRASGRPEARGLRREREFPLDMNVLAVERWAIALRRLDADVADEAEREHLLSRPDLVAALRAVPEREPTPFAQWLRRLSELIRRDRGESPPRPQPR